MVDSVKKYALIINGDTEERHLQNVERSLAVLHGKGFESFVASPSQPKLADHYALPNLETLPKLIAALNGKITSQDELVIYTTGHGGESEKREGFLGLQGEGDATTTNSFLEGIPYGQRTIIMDQCFAGNFKNRFVKDPKTLFVSGCSEGEHDYCQEVAPFFWADNVPDLNHDEVISWEERYANVVTNRMLHTIPQFMASENYLEEGVAPFKQEVETVENEEGLKKNLESLRPGQCAIINFSASWCGPCQSYKPVFENMAKRANGQHLFLRTENEGLAKAYGVIRFPTVMVINGEGVRYTAMNPEAVLNEMTMFSLPPAEVASTLLRRAEKIESPEEKISNLCEIASYLARMNEPEEAVKVFQQATAVARKFPTAAIMKSMGSFQGTSITSVKPIFTLIADYLAETNLQEKAVPVFESLIAALEAVEDIRTKNLCINNIFHILLEMNLQNKISLFEQLIAIARKTKEVKNRIDALIDIASSLVEANFEEMGLRVFQEAARTAKQCEDPNLQEKIFHRIHRLLKQSGLQNKIVLPPPPSTFDFLIFKLKQIF